MINDNAAWKKYSTAWKHRESNTPYRKLLQAFVSHANCVATPLDFDERFVSYS